MVRPLATDSKKKFIAIVGPTASGKSALALSVAEALGGELVCCDSVQLYRGFHIGAAAPTAEEISRVPHHLFGVLGPGDIEAGAGWFAVHARRAIDEICERGRVPVLVGGTGLYLRALLATDWDQELPSSESLRSKLQNLNDGELREKLLQVDPDRGNEIHPNDRFRHVRAIELFVLTQKTAAERNLASSTDVSGECLTVVLEADRAWLHQRIEQRSTMMLRDGLMDEIDELLCAGWAPTARPMQSIGYKEVLDARGSYDELCRVLPKIEASTRQYAKRQTTWFRKVSADLRLNVPSSGDLVLNITKLWT